MHIYIKKKQDKKRKNVHLKTSALFYLSISLSCWEAVRQFGFITSYHNAINGGRQTHYSHRIPHTAPALSNNCIFHPFYQYPASLSVCIHLFLFMSLSRVSLYWSVLFWVFFFSSFFFFHSNRDGEREREKENLYDGH